jgi:hypothetical protein
LIPAAAVGGAVMAAIGGAGASQALYAALMYALVVFGSWALARELMPDDHHSAFISMVLAVLLMMRKEMAGVLILFATLGLVRIVNRSTGLKARISDSVIVMLLTFWIIYGTQSPYFGAVAALAFVSDGMLNDALRRQWLFALVCLGGMIVYMVDHDIGLAYFSAPDTLAEWIGTLFLLIFALNILLLKSVRSCVDTGPETMDLGRVRAGMAVGLFAALQGLTRREDVVLLIATIAGLCIGMIFRKAFTNPARS